MRLEEGPEDNVCDIWLAVNGNSLKNRAYLLNKIDHPRPSSLILHYQQEMIDSLECVQPITIQSLNVCD